MLVGLGSLSLDADMDAFMSGGGGKKVCPEGGRGRMNACLWSYAGLFVAAGKSQGMSYRALTCLNGYLDLTIASHHVFRLAE